MVEDGVRLESPCGRAPSLFVDHALFLECVRRASTEPEPLRKVESLLAYLESFPLGAHNREVAERIEVLFDAAGTSAGAGPLRERFRSARERYLPPLLRS